jgi:hypothetical protein
MELKVRSLASIHAHVKERVARASSNLTNSPDRRPTAMPAMCSATDVDRLRRLLRPPHRPDGPASSLPAHRIH